MKDYMKTEPETLVENIAKPRLLICLGIALVITCVVIGLSSLSNRFLQRCIEYKTMYPDKLEREMQKEAEEKREAEAKKKKEQEEKEAARKKAEEAAAKQAEKARLTQTVQAEGAAAPVAPAASAARPQEKPAAETQGEVSNPGEPSFDFSTMQ